MNRAWVLVVGLVVLPSCFFDCLGGGPHGGTGGGGGSSGSSSTLVFDLVEASGEWSVAGTSTNGSCVSTTTASKTTLSLTTKGTDAITFVSHAGLLSGFFETDAVLGGRQGSQQCSGGAVEACPSSAEQDRHTTAFLSLTTDPSTLTPDAPDTQVVVPVLSGPLPPDLCDNASFTVGPRTLRGRPVTFAELRSGRFVVEGSGTTPLRDPPYDPVDPSITSVDGAMTWSFRFVFQTSDYDPAHAVTPQVITSFDECLEDVMPTVDDFVAAEGIFADGGLDVPLTTNGCRRLVIERSGSTETVSQQLTIGTKFSVDVGTQAVRSQRETRTLFSRTTDADGVHDRHDLDRDGFFEATDDFSFDAGVWVSTLSRDFAANSSTVLRQATRTRLDATTMNVRLEANGQLVDEFTSPLRQSACFDENSMPDPQCAPGPQPTCSGGVAPCMGTQKQAVLKSLTDALKKGKDCMKGAGFDSFQPEGKGLTLLGTGKLNLLCSTNPCDPYGYYEQVANPDGKHDFMINTARTGTGELAKTLFHEMLHSDTRFTHNDRFDNVAAKACKLQITDRTYACETMCFAPSRGGSCACARCLNPSKSGPPSDEICAKCDKFGACPGRQGIRSNGMTGNISQGVGAWCDRQRTFCDTKTECDTACTIGSCSPVKTVCDPTCN